MFLMTTRLCRCGAHSGVASLGSYVDGSDRGARSSLTGFIEEARLVPVLNAPWNAS